MSVWVMRWAVAVAAEETTALTGFSVTWERRPHRIKVLGFDAEAADVQGGSWADGERAFDVPHAAVEVVGLRGRPAATGTVALTVEGQGAVWARRREVGTATTYVEVPTHAGDVALWLAGFRFATDVAHADGFTIHTLSIALGPPAVSGGMARFPIRVAFAGGAVPDRAQALGTYGAAVEVDWVAIPCAPDEVQRESVASAVHLAPIAAGRQRDAERVESDLVWSLAAPAVVAGLTGFTVDIRDGLFDGRYARSLLVRVAPDAEEPHRSEVHLGFDNAGPLSRALRVELQADVTALALRPTDEAWTRTTVRSAPGTVGGRRRRAGK